ncbi:putative membrane protein [Lachnospiraceae bacterium JC7]|nr:putative membrane protein [Lachnospiraceae bacterium JC7]
MVALETLVYLAVGLLVMMIAYFIIDLLIPVDFPKEIQEGNKAVGWVSAGIYSSLGFIIRSAIISFEVSEAHDVLQGVISSVEFAAMGVVALMIGYFIVDLVNRKFNFGVELGKKNEAAGIMIFGIFMGVAFIVSGAIQ